MISRQFKGLQVHVSIADMSIWYASDNLEGKNAGSLQYSRPAMEATYA